MPQIGYAHRQAPMGRRGMVASCHPLASLAGVDVLRSGGNVVDAAIATNAVLAVTQPNFCGVGGDIFRTGMDAAGPVKFTGGDAFAVSACVECHGADGHGGVAPEDRAVAARVGTFVRCCSEDAVRRKVALEQLD